jgi:hypothetical protein
VHVLTDGTELVLGTFTHDNFPVYGFQPSQFDVDLRVNVAFNLLERAEERRSWRSVSQADAR